MQFTFMEINSEKKLFSQKIIFQKNYFAKKNLRIYWTPRIYTRRIQ